VDFQEEDLGEVIININIIFNRKMKKVVLFVLILLGLFFLIKLYVSNMEDKLLSKSEMVRELWIDVVENDKNKVYFLRKNHHQIDSLHSMEEIDTILNSNYFPDKCEINYEFKQSRLNNYTCKVYEKYKKKRVGSKILFELKKFDSIGNERIELYNHEAREFNTSASSFPNIIISRRNKLRRKDLCKVKYGVYSELENDYHEAMEWMLKKEREKGL